MGSITFIDSMKAWENAMHNGDSSDLEELLSNDFTWENIAMDGSSSKDETIKFALGIKKDVQASKSGIINPYMKEMICWLGRTACIKMEEMKLLFYALRIKVKMEVK